MHHGVVWQQGLLMLPQHFQQQDRAHRHLVAQSLLQPRSINWGMTELQWDEAALHSGNLSLQRCAGFFPSGKHFSAPDTDKLPIPVAPSAAQRDGFIYLVMPIAQPGTLRVTPRGADPTSTGAPEALEQVEVWDDSTPRPTPAKIMIASCNLSLVVAAEPPQGTHYILLGKLRPANAAGGLSLDPQCWPVSMSIKASETLVRHLSDISHRLYQRSRDSAGFSAKSGTLEILQEILFLAIINRAAPVISQLASLPELHPYDLHLLLLGLSSELHTFGVSSKNAPEFPRYNHLDQHASFSMPIAGMIKALERALPRRATRVPLRFEGAGTWAGSFPDERLLRPGTRLLLSLVAPGPADSARSNFPKISTIAASTRLQQLVDTQSAGLKIDPLHSEPQEVQSPNPRAVWFDIRVPTDEWKPLINGLGVYLSRKVPDIEMELWMITKDAGGI